MTAYYTLRKHQRGFIVPFHYRDDERDDGFAACTSYTGPVAIGSAQSTINAASPGTGITIANGTYTDQLVLDNDGTSSAPIVIRAETPGQVHFTGVGKIIFRGSYMTLSGFRFEEGVPAILSGSEGHEPIDLDQSSSDNLRVTNCKVGNYTPWASRVQRLIWVYGTNHRVDHCEFHTKTDDGEMFRLRADGGGGSGHRVDHIYFHTSSSGSSLETITCGIQDADMDSIIEDCYFYDLNADLEQISIKARGITVRNSTFEFCNGGITGRANWGGSTITGNITIGDASRVRDAYGIRCFGPNNTVTNNHQKDCRWGILLGAGSTDGACYEAVTSSTCTGNRFTNSESVDLDSNWNFNVTPGGCPLNDVPTSGNTISDNSGAAVVDNALTATSSLIGVKW